MYYLIYFATPIILELLMALLFKFKGKKLYLYLAGVNFVTQSLTLLLLPLLNGSMIILFVIPVAVIFFFITELVLHTIFMPKLSDKITKGKAFLYGLLANIVTIIAEVIITLTVL